MAAVALGQNVKTYPTTQCKFLLILKMGVHVPVFIGASLGCNAQNYAKPFNGMLNWHIRLFGDANRIVRLLMASKKIDNI